MSAREVIRQEMISARAVLVTASHDTPNDLQKPERERVIRMRIEGLTRAIDELDRTFGN